MGEGPMAAPPAAGTVIEARCIGCGTCVLACAYGAVRLRVTVDGAKAAVDPALCRGDGLCSSLCATGAVVLRGFADEDIRRQIDAALRGSRGAGPEPPARRRGRGERA